MNKSLDQLLKEAKVTIEENTRNVLECGEINMYGVEPENFSSIIHYSSTNNTFNYDSSYSDYDVFREGNLILSCVSADEVDQYIKDIISQNTEAAVCGNAQMEGDIYLKSARDLIVRQILEGVSSIDESHVERLLSQDTLETEEFTLVFNLDNANKTDAPICRIEPCEYSGGKNEYVIELYVDAYLYERDQMEIMDLYIHKALADALAKIELLLANAQSK